MTLHANGYRYDLDERYALYKLYKDRNYLNYNFYNNRAKRGDINVTLTSPQGSTSTLLFNRPYDIVTTEGYLNWPFLSVLHWGENPNGQWTIRVYWKNSRGSARMSNISISLYGVFGTPTAVSNIPFQCDIACARSKGCAAAGPQYCDACNNTLLRNATTLECIQPFECQAPNSIASNYCYLPSIPEKIAVYNPFTVLTFMLALLFIMFSLLMKTSKTRLYICKKIHMFLKY